MIVWYGAVARLGIGRGKYTARDVTLTLRERFSTVVVLSRANWIELAVRPRVKISKRTALQGSISYRKIIKRYVVMTNSASVSIQWTLRLPFYIDGLSAKLHLKMGVVKIKMLWSVMQAFY